jgi:hypothetical protein
MHIPILKILKFSNSDSNNILVFLPKKLDPRIEAKILLEAFFFVQRRTENNLP